MTSSAETFWPAVRDLFHRAVELPAEARGSFLDQACTDASVRAEVVSLLEAHDGEGPFIPESIWEVIDRTDGQLPAGTMIGPYRVVRTIGQGGMGAVFLAERDDDEFQQRVALKLVRGGAILAHRFRQERQILAALEHPHIARLLDGGSTADGLPYLVMEFVDGFPIDDYTKGLPLPEKLGLFLQLCDAVAYAHRNLVIHRDIKPANILVAPGGTAKLLDFGIAKLTNPADSRATATRIMTPDYASPEQLAGRMVTTASDVYSLGVVLFEILTESRLHAPTRTGGSDAPLVSQVTRSRALRGDLDGIVAMAMEHDPERRYGTVEELAADIRRHLSGHPVVARRATVAYRAAKFVRRNGLATAASAVGLAVLVAAFAITVREKRLAERRFDQVRALARSVVFELHDAIAPLSGSTAARELLVRRALGYLDALAAEAGDRPELQIELAGAYLKIGDVQGLPYSPNLGDTAGALRSYRKALDIAAVADEAARTRQTQTLLADVRDRMGLVEQRRLNWVNAIRAHESARELREGLTPRTTAANIALARTWVGIGDSLYVGGRKIPASMRTRPPEEAYLEALRVLAGVPPSGPHRLDRLREIARANQRLGGYFTGRNPRRSLEHHDAALAAMREWTSIVPEDSVARRHYADQLVMKATVQSRAGDAAGALEGTRRALAILQPLAQADPSNLEAQHDVAFAHEQLATALIRLERWEEAGRAARHVLELRTHLFDADPKNREAKRGMAVGYGLVSAVERSRGNLAAAEAARAKSNAIMAELTR